MVERKPRLEGKVAIVTGGGAREQGPKSGVGRAISITFAREGAKIVVSDKILGNAEQTVAAIREEGRRGGGGGGRRHQGRRLPAHRRCSH